MRPRRPRSQEVTFDTVRRLALELPGVEEGISYRTTAFRVSGKIIARFHQDGDSLALKAEYSTREVLMGAHPEAFYLTDHYRSYPWVLVRVANVEEGLLQKLLEDAWRSLAPKRLVAAYDD